MARKKHTKNIANKAKHSKLLQQKKNKERIQKEARAKKLKAILLKSKEA